MTLFFIISCYFVTMIYCGPNELSVNTVGGESAPLEGYASHQEFVKNAQDLFGRKVQATAESWFRYLKLNPDQFLTNIDSNQYLFLQLLQSLTTKDVTFSNQLLELAADINQKVIINDWIRSNIEVPTDKLYRVVESIVKADSMGLSKIPETITKEILLMMNKSEIFLESCMKGDPVIVEWLFQAGVILELDQPFKIAYENEKWDVVKILIRNGALKNAEVMEREKSVANGSLLRLALESNAPEAVAGLLEAGSPVNGVDENGASPLYLAIENDDIEAANVLVSNGANASLRTNSGNSPLHAAALNGNLNGVRFLLSLDSSINEKNYLGLTPLNIADQSGIFHIVKYLLHKNVSFPNIITSDPAAFPYILPFMSEYGALIQKDDPEYIENYCQITQLMYQRANHAPFEKGLKNKLLEIVIKNKILFLSQCLINLGADITATNRNNETFLFYATRGGSYDIVRLLLNEGVDVNAQDVDGFTALHVAAGSGVLDIVSLLLKRGADINAESKEGFTALHAAAEEGHSTIVDFLLDKKINKIYITATSNGYPQKTPLQLAAFKGHLNLVKNFLNKGLFTDVKANGMWTTIHAAAKAGHANIVGYLLDRGFGVNVTDRKGKTPLFWAAYGGSIPTVKLLLERGADIQTKSNNEYTSYKFGKLLKSRESPLHVAALNGHKEVCKILINKGIDKDVRDAIGETPLYNAVLRGHYDLTKYLLEQKASKNIRTINGTTVLHAAAAEGHEDIVDLLLDKGMDIEVTDNQLCTPLYSAAKSGRVGSVRHLIDKLADVNAITDLGDTPLTAAVTGGNNDVVLLMLDKGAKVIAHDKNGNTPLIEAVSLGFLDIVSLLLEHEADLLYEPSKRSDGFTALHVAASGDPKMIEMLLDRHASTFAKAADGTTPLYQAVNWDNDEAVDVILKCPKCYNKIDTNNTNKHDKWSCLHVSVTRGNLKITKLLLDNEAYVNPLNEDKDTPFHLAVKEGHYEIVKLLLDRGADVTIKNKDGKRAYDIAKNNVSHPEILNLRLCNCAAKI